MNAQEDQSENKKPVNAYMKYSGLAFQLLGSMAILGWLGYKLDQKLSLQFPAFMLLFGFLAFGSVMYQVYKSLKQQQFGKISTNVNPCCSPNSGNWPMGIRNHTRVFLSNPHFSFREYSGVVQIFVKNKTAAP